MYQDLVLNVLFFIGIRSAIGILTLRMNRPMMMNGAVTIIDEGKQWCLYRTMM